REHCHPAHGQARVGPATRPGGRGGDRPVRVRPAGRVRLGRTMATLHVSFALPLRAFVLEIELEVEGTVALVRPSGAGKTSFLRAVTGLVKPASGRIALDDEVWFDAGRKIFRKPDERRVGLVFQEYALFPHMTVRENVAYAGRRRVDEYLERFRISHLA